MESKIPNVNSLHQEKYTKEKARNDVFTLVLNKCIEKIIYTNKNTEQTYVFFEVPKILIGFPFYDMKSCIIFLMQKLSKENYKVHFIEPFYLYVDWGTAVSKDLPDNFIYTSNPEKLKLQTKELLKKYPNTSKVVFEYADAGSSSKQKKKNKK
jgi:hypothetical protein